MFHISRLSSKICTDAADHTLGQVLLALTMKSNFFMIKCQMFYSITKLFGCWITEGHTGQQTQLIGYIKIPVIHLERKSDCQAVLQTISMMQVKSLQW